MTLRAHTYVVNPGMITLFFCVFLVSFSCSKKVSRVEPKIASGGVNILAMDVSGNGQPDTWRHVMPEKDGKETLLKEEIDLNSDGKIDVWKTYKNGKLSEISMDFDFDQMVDQKEFFENGVVVRAEIFYLSKKNPNAWRFYENGALAREERDTNQDGKPDEWLYFENLQLKRIGRDTNKDGIVDFWE